MTPHLDGGVSPSPPAEGGEGRGAEGRFSWNSPLPAPASRGEGEDLRSWPWRIERQWRLARTPAPTRRKRFCGKGSFWLSVQSHWTCWSGVYLVYKSNHRAGDGG